MITLQVTMFDDLHNASEVEEWDSFTYGDAEYTIVTAAQLIQEIGCDTPLAKELGALGPEALIAFHG